MTSDAMVTVAEVRVLEGPNLYFAKPAVKVSLELPGYLDAQERALSDLARRIGLRGNRPGAPGSEQRQRFVARVVERAVRRLATTISRGKIPPSFFTPQAAMPLSSAGGSRRSG